jgi:hypothetical protein
VGYANFSLSRKISDVDHLRVDFEDFHSLFIIIIITIYGYMDYDNFFSV